MTIISIKFKERSEGADEILIWIPQTSVAIGSLVFFICVFHHLVFSILNLKFSWAIASPERGILPNSPNTSPPTVS